VSLENRPALDLIAGYGGHDEALIYADPPYLRSTKGCGNNYVHDMGSPAEHRELADALHGCRAAVVLSGYASTLYEELYDGWHRVELRTRTGNAAPRRQARIEVLWSNRPLGADHLFGGGW
jgi:DNA adenine methylase